MPQANYYTVEITVRIREGRYDGPEEALAAALEDLNISRELIVHATVSKRMEGAVNPPRRLAS
jgi:hypothetical protein